MIPNNDFTRLRPIADIVECHLIFGTPPAVIARLNGFNHVNHLVGLLSRTGYNGIATQLYNAANEETTA